MGIEQTRRALNQLENELARLEKKLAELTKKEAEKIKRINDIQKSITKNTSPSIIQSKMRQIQGYNNDLTRITSEKAVMSKKIADKRQKHADTVIKLQKRKLRLKEKPLKPNKAIQEGYEKRISELASTIIKKVR